MRCAFLPVLVLVLTASAFVNIAAPDRPTYAAERPNVVVILTDDQGWGDLSLHGNTNLSTPNIDALARAGARFDRFFVCPVCAPTRAEYLTGRYHPRCGVRGVSTGQERLNADEKTIANAFKAAGYATGAFGKWHNGMQAPYHPLSRGFDEYYGFASGHWGHYFNPVLEHNGEIVRGNGYIIDDLTDHAISFIEQHRNTPFFCYLPLNTPHSPFQVPDKFYAKFKDASIKMKHRDPAREDLSKTRAALAMVENIDWNVGRLLKKLDDLKLSASTIVVFFCDNGPNSYRWNDGMKGRKGSTDEGGVRSPLFIRWPGKVRPRLHTPIAGAIDLMPTLTSLAGVPLPAGHKPLDGRSFKPALLGNPAPAAPRMLFSAQRGKVSVRTQRRRLDAAGNLFDMQKDPGQTAHVNKLQPAIRKRLQSAVAAFKREAFAGLGKRDDRPFTIGYSRALTHLPARDGIGHGNVQRSARAPNCSYFTNWKATGDRITWDVECAAAGDYDVTVYYTCPQGDTGSKVQLSFGDAKLPFAVDTAHDPPLRGAEADRSDRGNESFVKDFKALKLGTMKLKKTRAQLTLQALTVAGDSVMDVRMITFRRK